MRRMADSASTSARRLSTSWAVTSAPRSQAVIMASTSRETQLPPRSCSSVAGMLASLRGIIRLGGPSCDRQPARELVEDSADAPLVHSRPCRDLAHPVAVHPQPDDLMMSRRAGAQDIFPDFAALRYL